MCSMMRESMKKTDTEPQGGWGRGGRCRATYCETSKSMLSHTLFDLLPP